MEKTFAVGREFDVVDCCKLDHVVPLDDKEDECRISRDLEGCQATGAMLARWGSTLERNALSVVGSP